MPTLKKRNPRFDSVEAYAICACVMAACTCTCWCNCTCYTSAAKASVNYTGGMQGSQILAGRQNYKLSENNTA